MGEILSSEPCGLLIVNKHAGVTSLDIVNMVRRLFGIRRVGHTGTLDPMATGVMVVLIGRAAKAAELVPSDRKRYRAIMRLGITTDTEDTTGAVLTTSEAIPDAEKVISVCSEFVGSIEQIPPMYSALKVNGQKLVDIARKGGNVERKPRPITVFSMSCTPTDRADEFILDVECSGGTYIRTLCADIGARLGCGGAMASLLRTEACGFGLEESMSVDELRALTPAELSSRLIPIEELFRELPSVTLPAFYERLFRSGCEIYQKKIGSSYQTDQLLRVCGEECGFFALGKACEYESGSAIKSIKLFSL